MTRKIKKLIKDFDISSFRFSGGMGGGSDSGVPDDLLTTKGDTHGYTTENARVPIGIDTTVLTADSTQPLGLAWAAASGGGGVDTKQVVMDYSTTIADYSTPVSASASSAATAGVFTIMANSAYDNPQAVYDIGASNIGSTWTLRTKIVYTNLTNTASGQAFQFQLGLSDSSTLTGETPSGISAIMQNRAAHGALTDQNPYLRQYDPSGNEATAGVLVSSPLTATRYIQLQRKGTNSIEMKIYSDSGYSVLLETLTNAATAGAASGLRYLITRIYQQTVTDVNTIAIQAIALYNNTLTPVTPTWEWDGGAGGWTTTDNGGTVTLTSGSGSGNAIDDDLATYWESSAAANNWIYVDVGSEKDLSQMTIYPNAATTETQYKIQYSNDLVTWTDLRLINVSALTNAAYNYIRFNTVTARYVRIYGNSGTSYVMAINEIKVDETNAVATEHGHLEIDPTDVSLALDGT